MGAPLPLEMHRKSRQSPAFLCTRDNCGLSEVVDTPGHDFRCQLHHQLDGARQLRAAAGDSLGGMCDLVGFHLLENGVGLAVRWRNLGDVLFQVRLDLALGLRNESETPLVAGDAGRGTDSEGTGVPQRVQQARATTEFVNTTLAPVEVIVLLLRGAFHVLAHRWVFRRDGMSLVKRLGADLAGVVDAHETGHVAQLRLVQGGLRQVAGRVGAVCGRYFAAGGADGLVEGTELASKSLEDIVKSSEGGVFNNAAQIWNHSFYWNCLTPNGGGEPTGAVADAAAPAPQAQQQRERIAGLESRRLRVAAEIDRLEAAQAGDAPPGDPWRDA